MNVTLVGIRGSGKSTVGRQLAERLGFEFVDADDVVESRAGKSIQEMFADEGEKFFRDLEADVMAELLQKRDMVLAAGGGVVLREETRDRMRAPGVYVIYLRVSAGKSLERTRQDPSTGSRRPALTSLPAEAEVAQILVDREHLYRHVAQLELDVENADVRTLSETIHRELLAYQAEKAGND